MKPHTLEARRKMSEAHKGRTPWNKGKKLSPEDHHKLLERFRNNPSKGMLGKKHSLETRRKMSEVQIGKKHSIETRRKMSEAHKGKTLSDEHRKNLSKAHSSEEVRIKKSESMKGKNAHPCQLLAHKFYLSLPNSMTEKEKKKALRDKFAEVVHEDTIGRWTRKWQSET